jgi:tetratricopeptide (TPR) repeat protein
VIIGSAALALLVAAALYVTLSTGPSEAPLSANVIAVVPFTVRGSPELDYLGEGIVDLMSAKLDGAGPLTAVSPRAIISLINETGVDVSDPAAGRRVARQLRAGRYVTGDVLELAGQITLTAYLHDTQRTDAPSQQATTEGSTDDLFEVIDELVTDLLAGSMSGPEDRIQKLATVTSASLPAAKEYLQGERLLRSGQYREAAEAYSRAVEIDTAFALAYYRKSIAADWIDAYDVRSTADKAFEFAEQLSPRDRSLLAALRMRRHGQNDEAAQAYRAHLHHYGDEVEALVQLGEALFHDNPRRGRPIAEAAVPFQQAVDLEPSNLIAQIHLARILALNDSIPALTRTAAYLAEVAPESERSLEVESIYAYAAGDTARQRQVRELLTDKPWYYTWYAVHGVATFARDTHGAYEILETRTTDQDLLLMLVPNLQVVQGKHDGFRSFMSGMGNRRHANWDIYEAFVLTSGAYPADDGELSAVLDRVLEADPDEVLRTAWIPAYEDLTLRFAEFELDYNVALLLIHLGRIAEAREIIDAMAATDDFPGLGSLRQDAVNGLEAEIFYRSGEFERALDLVRLIAHEVPHAATVRSLADGTRSRFLRAELELQVGDIDVARGYYLGFDQSWSPWDTNYRSVVYQRLGEIAEQEGKAEDAIGYYTRLLDLWRDCDPELLAARNEIQDRRDALLENRSPN